MSNENKMDDEDGLDVFDKAVNAMVTGGLYYGTSRLVRKALAKRATKAAQERAARMEIPLTLGAGAIGYMHPGTEEQRAIARARRAKERKRRR